MTWKVWAPIGALFAALAMLFVIYLEGRARGASIEKQKTSVAVAAAARATEEAELARRVGARLDAMNIRRAQSADIVREHALAVLKSEDTNEPLSEGRRARLADADRRLCGINASLGGCESTLLPDS